MRRFRDLPIKAKLTMAGILASGTALTLAGTAFVTYDLMSLRQAMVLRLAVQADIIGSNSVSAVLFSDPRSASETLAALRAEPHIMAAAVYTPEGQPFATYVRSDLSQAQALPAGLAQSSEGYRFESGRLVVTRRMLFKEKPIGAVFILSDLGQINQHVRRDLMIVGGVLLASLVLAFFISTALQQRISGPILRLAETARRIAVEKDYTVRASGDSRDEIGLLVTAFNEMLAQIRGRDDELREAHDRLEQRVTERTSQLEATNKELEAFCYSVSHDLRAPLRHISGFANLLEEDSGSTLGEAGKRQVRKISEAANRMGRLIDDLLEFSKMGRTEMRSVTVNLDDLLKEVIRDCKPETNGRSIDWRVAPLPRVAGDPAMLRLVLINLVSNAVKYTGKRDEPRIEVGVQNGAGDEVVVFVRDNGVGFDMQYASKLFGVFQRLHRAEEFEGTGIGLANVRRIIHRHGGRTWAEGQSGQGAAFYFSLPNLQEGTTWPS